MRGLQCTGIRRHQLELMSELCSLPGALTTMQQMQLEHQHFSDADTLNASWPVAAAPGEEGVFEAGAGVLHVRLQPTLPALSMLVTSHTGATCAHTGGQSACMPA